VRHCSGPDPILAAIEKHRSATAAYGDAVSRNFSLEEELPQDRRKSDVTHCESKIVETDDPRWIASEKRWKRIAPPLLKE
jgi:hypothetical protein